MRVYTSGPIAGIDDYLERFDKAEALLRRHGYHVTNPCRVSACADGKCVESTHDDTARSNGHTWACYLKHDIRAMLACDAVALLDGWQNSPGANAERNVALVVRMPVHTLAEFLMEV